MSINLPDLVKQITINYVEHYYREFVAQYPGGKVPESELRKYVDNMYDTKQLDLKKYIRKTLKTNLKEEYPAMATEQILLEMFANPQYAKERVIQELMRK